MQWCLVVANILPSKKVQVPNAVLLQWDHFVRKDFEIHLHNSSNHEVAVEQHYFQPQSGEWLIEPEELQPLRQTEKIKTAKPAVLTPVSGPQLIC